MMFRSRLKLVTLVAVVLAGLGSAAWAASRPTPIVLDTDIGSDIDDAFALALVLKSPELDLRAVTTVSGDTQARARLAAKMLWVAGRRDVPVAAGIPSSKAIVDQAKWADGFSSPMLLHESGVELLRKEIDRGHGKIVVVAIGPLTDIAALLKQYPQEKRNIREIVLMGGSIAQGYYPGSGATTEYNIAADAYAAQTVFTSGIPILMAPLDVTWHTQMDSAHLDKLFAEGTPLTSALRDLYQLWGHPTPTLHDPMAVSLLLDPGLCTIRKMNVEVTGRGMTVPVAGKPANAAVAVQTDSARFIKFYLERVAHNSKQGNKSANH